MPLFIDRHDVPEITAEQVAQAHLADLEMGGKFGLHFLAYWFDADQGEAFCLCQAGLPGQPGACGRPRHTEAEVPPQV